MSDCLSAASKIADEIKTAVYQAGISRVKSFLGACNVFKIILEDFCMIARPLDLYLRKRMKLDWSDPSTVDPNAFNTFKSRFLEPPVLALPHLHRILVVDTDLSAYAWRSVFFQEKYKSIPIEWDMIGY